jgi:hypothetical protein
LCQVDGFIAFVKESLMSNPKFWGPADREEWKVSEKFGKETTGTEVAEVFQDIIRGRVCKSDSDFSFGFSLVFSTCEFLKTY